MMTNKLFLTAELYWYSESDQDDSDSDLDNSSEDVSYVTCDEEVSSQETTDSEGGTKPQTFTSDL